MKRYDWDDVREIAESLFDEYDYMLPWFRDAWNLLMFERPIFETKTVQSKLSITDRADVLIWLISLYDLFHDYQSLISDAEGYGGYEIPVEHGYEMREFNDKDLGAKIKSMEEWEHLITEFIKDQIYKRLLSRKDLDLEQDAFYDPERELLDPVHFYENALDFSVDTILSEEIERRRKKFISDVFSYFNYEPRDILLFMAGYHYRSQYTQYNEKTKQINLWKEKLLTEIESAKDKTGSHAFDIELQYFQMLNDFNKEFPVSIPNLFKQISQYGYKNAIGRVLKWIEDDMQEFKDPKYVSSL